MEGTAYKTAKNGLVFFAYREEGDAISAVLAYDEKTHSFSDIIEYIACILKEVFGVSAALRESAEITMRSFFDCYLEARRKEIANYSGYHHTLGDWSLDLFNFGTDKDYANNCKFNLEERLIPARVPEMHVILFSIQ